METTPRLDDVEKVPSRPRRASADQNAVEVERFFAALRAAQVGFMEAVGQAQAELGRDSGQLSHVAAIQGRLTRQFFDAQRSIMMRRAEVDAEVALIGATAEEQADELVSAARAKATASALHERSTVPASRRCLPRPEMFVSTSSVDIAADTQVEPPQRSPRQEIAALGAAVVRTMADADSLARVIDEAFEPDDPDGAAAERQLSQLLDAWWRAENQEGRAIIDDANARAAMRHHVAGIEASEITVDIIDTFDIVDSEPSFDITLATDAETATEISDVADIADMSEIADISGVGGPDDQTVTSAVPTSTHLPDLMLAALDTADPDGLQSLLVALAASLDVQPVATVRATSEVCTAGMADPVDDLVIRADRVAAADGAASNAPDETFRSFWVKGNTPADDTSGWGWIPVHVVLPMMAVTFVLALVLAWIG